MWHPWISWLLAMKFRPKVLYISLQELSNLWTGLKIGLHNFSVENRSFLQYLSEETDEIFPASCLQNECFFLKKSANDACRWIEYREIFLEDCSFDISNGFRIGLGWWDYGNDYNHMLVWFFESGGFTEMFYTVRWLMVDRTYVRCVFYAYLFAVNNRLKFVYLRLLFCCPPIFESVHKWPFYDRLLQQLWRNWLRSRSYLSSYAIGLSFQSASCKRCIHHCRANHGCCYPKWTLCFMTR